MQYACLTRGGASPLDLKGEKCSSVRLDAEEPGSLARQTQVARLTWLRQGTAGLQRISARCDLRAIGQRLGFEREHMLPGTVIGEVDDLAVSDMIPNRR